MKKPSHSIDEVQVIEVRGPWNTKSGGKLMVMFGMPLATAQEEYLCYEAEELSLVPMDIRGLRVYTVRNLPKGGVGGGEWHRIRQEIVFVLKGSFVWGCEDLFGGYKEFNLSPEYGLWMPPFILHTYEVCEAESEFLIVANTLFVPEDPTTHDTYSLESFCNLKKEYV